MSADDVDPSAMFELVIVGGGNMGAALIGGLVDAGVYSGDQMAVVELRAERRTELVQLFPTVKVTESVPPCRGAVLAVKPADTPTAAAAASGAGADRVLSIAAGVRLESIEAALGEGVAALRAMPNTPALVGKGVAALARGTTASDTDVAWAETILGAVGIVEQLPEPDLDAFTGVAGSGPAYVFLVAEALVEAAIAEGLAPSTAERVVCQLLLGASTLLDRDGDPAQLRAAVTSPGGTTAAGLRVLEEHAVRAAFGDAVSAATVRSRELG